MYRPQSYPKTIINVKKVKLEEQEDCIDVETIPRDEVPGI